MRTQSQQRQEIVNFLYHHFLMNFSKKNTEDFFIRKKKKTFNEWQTQILKFAFQNWNNIITLISKQLDKKWTFNAISNLEKAIFIIAISEYFSEITPYEVAISEAIKQVQKLGGHHSHTYVNRILDVIFKEKNKKPV